METLVLDDPERGREHGEEASALAARDKVLGAKQSWTKESARVTADALDALGRTEEAKVAAGGSTGSRSRRSPRCHEHSSPALAHRAAPFAVERHLFGIV